MNEAFEMIEEFIFGKYEPLAFSYDFPDYLIEHYNEMLTENEIVTELLNENFPDICAEYERGKEPSGFIENVKKEYDTIKAAM